MTLKEAFEKIGRTTFHHIDCVGNIKTTSMIDSVEYQTLLKYFTKPTAEEVIKAIEDEMQWTTVYEDNQFNFDVGGYLIKMDDKGRILFNCHPTPKLSELVGRFYGEMK